jgi:hypothetical protein
MFDKSVTLVMRLLENINQKLALTTCLVVIVHNLNNLLNIVVGGQIQ